MPELFSYPSQHRFLDRVMDLGRAWDTALATPLFRFIDPRYSESDEIVEGRGAAYASGRWHVKGAAPISYTAREPETALAEALANARYYRLPLRTAPPKVLVCLNLKAMRVLDLRDGELRSLLRLSAKTMSGTDWRRENQQGRQAVTQAWGEIFGFAGFEAVIAPSAAVKHGTNVLVFPRNLRPGSRFEVENEVRWPKI
jgi:RES domain-containing protein